jgi:hypothetical protein
MSHLERKLIGVIHKRSPKSLVSKTTDTGWTTGVQFHERNNFSVHRCISAGMGSTKPPHQLVWEAPSLEMKQPEREVQFQVPTVRMLDLYMHFLVRLHDVVLKHKQMLPLPCYV